MSNHSVRWAFNLTKWSPTPSEMLLATGCIQQEEKDRLAKFVFKSDFKSSLIGRLMMRKFVNDITGVPYNEIIFARDEKSKPVLLNPKTGISFNVSHQGDYTVLAGIGDNLQIGVDVMKFDYPSNRNTTEYFRIMSRTFSNSEWDTIKNAGSEKNQLKMFYRHWCLKESYVKAIGKGITVNLQEIVFRINTSNLTKNYIVDDSEISVKGKKLEWEFHEMLLDDEHCISVAFNAKNQQKLPFYDITFDEVMSQAAPLNEFDQEYCNKFFAKLDKN